MDENKAKEALRSLAKARVKLVLAKDAQAVFFATLALRLTPKALAVGTAAVDGKSIFIDPDWWGSLSADEQVGVLAHEVLHIALQHHTRRGNRDLSRWNIAGDLAINGTLRAAHYQLPEEGVFPGEGKFSDFPADLSTEEYYRLLAEQDGDGSGGDSEGDSDGDSQDGGGSASGQKVEDPGGCGGILDAAQDSAGIEESSREWEVAVRQAAEAAKQASQQGRGTLPGALSRLVDTILKPKVDWRAVLRQFVSERVQEDFSWLRPNRRSVGGYGPLLPGLDGQKLGRVVLVVDTSGSITGEDLAQFQAECRDVADSFDPEISIVYHDSEVAGVEEWFPGDPPLTLNPVGGGGTDHRPVFAWVEKNAEDAAAVVCLTDLYTSFPEREPLVPTLWVTNGGTEAPFGEVVELR